MGEDGAPPPADLLPVQRAATLPYRLIRVLALPLLYLLFKIRVRGREHIPRGKTFVIIANHLNWLDSFAILATFPVEPRVHFLGDTTILVTRKTQWFIVRKVGGFIPVDRNRHADTTLFAHVNTCLQRGGVVALYPEGNYGTREGALLPFKRGFAHFAVDNQVPVVPVAFSGTKDLWLRKPIRVVIGKPLLPDGHTVDSLVALAEQRLAAMLPVYVEPRGPKLLRRRLTNLF